MEKRKDTKEKKDMKKRINPVKNPYQRKNKLALRDNK
jgi:hypothetical protein